MYFTIQRKFVLSRISQQAVGNRQANELERGRRMFALGFLFLAPGESNTPRRRPLLLFLLLLLSQLAASRHRGPFHSMPRESYTCIPRMSGGSPICLVSFPSFLPVRRPRGFDQVQGSLARSVPFHLKICLAFLVECAHSPSHSVPLCSLRVGVPLGFGASARGATPLPPAAPPPPPPEAEGGEGMWRGRGHGGGGGSGVSALPLSFDGAAVGRFPEAS